MVFRFRARTLKNISAVYRRRSERLGKYAERKLSAVEVAILNGGDIVSIIDLIDEYGRAREHAGRCNGVIAFCLALLRTADRK